MVGSLFINPDITLQKDLGFQFISIFHLILHLWGNDHQAASSYAVKSTNYLGGRRLGFSVQGLGFKV